MGIRASDTYATCQVRETIEHFFIDCVKVQHMWGQIENIIAIKTGKQVKLLQYEKLLGITSRDKVSKKCIEYINSLMLVGKMVISKIKYGKARDYVYLLETELRSRNLW